MALAVTVPSDGSTALPFLKWAGGKRRLVPILRLLMPKTYRRYIEPFVGGGALFFGVGADAALLSDANEELISTYHVVRDHVDELITSLHRHRNTKQYFEEMRRVDPATLSQVEAASRFIYLNRTCYNGLYRVNRQGRFNVPFGNYKKPQLVPAKALRHASRALRGVTLRGGDFESVVADCQEGDFVYFDPPYVPISEYSDFRRYHREIFTLEDHRRLAASFADLAAAGCYVMLSNSATSLVREMYSEWFITSVSAPRSISCNGATRGNVEEYVITSYDPGHRAHGS